jgi:hypothetical protein
MQATLSKEAAAVVGRIQDRAGLARALVAGIDHENELTAGHIQEDYLSGPTGDHTLSVRTGLLRASVFCAPTVLAGEQLVGGIGSNVVYAAAHEFGVDKIVAVQSHQSRDAMSDRYQHGSALLDRFTALRLGILSKRQVSQKVRDSGQWQFAPRGAARKVKGGMVPRGAHERHLRLPERGMFRHGLSDRLADLATALSSRIIRFWQGLAG